ncbi:MAG: LeuD/DmdB family oxidoreductase small subunit [Planctomycetota bacterium]|jgi:methanogen homoaconitase small subunit
MESLPNRVWRFGDDVNTDQIVPGRFAPYMTSEAELRKAPFIEARPEFAAEVRPGDVIVAGPNFGCGSSREYAAQALRLCELGAILAPSFARIFYRNALNLGLPLIECDARELAEGASLRLDLEEGQLHHAAGALTLPEIPAIARDVWTVGGLVPYVQRYGRLPVEAAR